MFNWERLLIHRTIKSIKDPIIIAKGIGVGYGEVVEVIDKNGRRLGQVIGIEGDKYVIEVLEGVKGLGKETGISRTFETYKIDLSDLILGRTFDGKGEPLDDKEEIISSERQDINGRIINPYFRQVPNQRIETGISSIDLLNTIVKGQKIGLFFSPGIESIDIGLQILRQSILNIKNLIVVFGGIGLRSEEIHYIQEKVEEFKVKDKTVMYLNSIDDPPEEAIITPRIALTTAEYFAYDKGYDVLVLIGDILNYADALRNLSSSKGELTTRQGYPAYLFSDLASIYERCGMIRKRRGSVTQLPFLTMPNDDLTHPVPDTTGYISEGQLIFSKEFESQGISPPLDILNSLSRMMHFAITPEHLEIANKIYNIYGEGAKFEEIASMMGQDVLDEEAKKILKKKEKINEELLNQDIHENRKLSESIRIAKRIIENH